MTAALIDHLWQSWLCLVAVGLSLMTRTKGMIPEVWPQPLTVSPIERTPPQ